MVTTAPGRAGAGEATIMETRLDGRTCLIVAGALLGSLVLPGGLRATGGPGASRTHTGTSVRPPTPGNIIIGFQPQAKQSDRTALLVANGLREVSRIPKLDVWIARPTGKADLKELCKLFAKNRLVRYAEEDQWYESYSVTPDDPLFVSGDQWGFLKVDMPCAWGFAKGSSTVFIAVVDSGVDVYHPDLANKVLVLPGLNSIASECLDSQYGCSTVECDPDSPFDATGHGTAVAGIAAAQTDNGKGMAGAGWECKILPIKAGCAQFSTAAILLGIRLAADNAKVINMSFGRSDPSLALLDAIWYARGRNCVMVAATGNDMSQTVGFPAGFAAKGSIGGIEYDDMVISVGASDTQDHMVWNLTATCSGGAVWGSSSGPSVESVSVLAPGTGIWSPTVGSGYDCRDGTSEAAPLVSGLVGLLVSANSNMTATNYHEIVKKTALPLPLPLPTSTSPLSVPNIYSGWGRVDACQAFKPLPPINFRAECTGTDYKIVWDLPWARLYAIVSCTIYRGDSPFGPFASIANQGVRTIPDYHQEFYDSGATPGQTYYYKVSCVDSQGSEGLISAPVVAPSVPPPSVTATWDYKAIATTGSAELTVSVANPDGSPLANSPVTLSTSDGTLTPVSGTTDSSGLFEATFATNGKLGSNTVSIAAGCAVSYASIIVVDPTTLRLEEIRFEGPYCSPAPLPLYDRLVIPVKRTLPIDAYLVGTYGSVDYPVGGETISFSVVSNPPDSDAKAPGPAVTNGYGNAHAYGFYAGLVYGMYTIRMSHASAVPRDIEVRVVGEMLQFGGDPKHSGVKDYERLRPPLHLFWNHPTGSAIYGSISVARGVLESDVKATNCYGLTILGGNGIGVLTLDESGSEILLNRYWGGGWNADQYQTLAVTPLGLDGWPDYLPAHLRGDLNPPAPGNCWDLLGCMGAFVQTGAFTGEATWMYLDPQVLSMIDGFGRGSPVVFEPHRNQRFRSLIPALQATSYSRCAVALGNGLLGVFFAAGDPRLGDSAYIEMSPQEMWLAGEGVPLRMDSTPAVGGSGYLYAIDVSGKIWAVDLASSLKDRLEHPASYSLMASVAWTYPPGPGPGPVSAPSPTFNSSPSVASISAGNEVVYVGSEDSYLYALDGATGALKWKYLTGGPVRSSPAVVTRNGQTIVLVGSNDGRLYAIQDMGSTAWEMWSYTTSGAVESSPTVANGFVYVGSDDGQLYQLELDTGTLVAACSPDGSAIKGRPAVADGKVYVGTENGTVFAYGPGVGCPVRVHQVEGLSGIHLAWDPPLAGTYPLSRYRVYRSSAAGGPFTLVAEQAASTTSVADTPPTCGTWYYRVLAVDIQGNVSENCGEDCKPVALTNPSAELIPVSLVATPSSTRYCVGDKSVLHLTVSNTGGISATNVSASVSIEQGSATVLWSSTVPLLLPGRTAVVHTMFSVTGEGPLALSVRATGIDTCSGTRIVSSTGFFGPLDVRNPDLKITVSAPS